MRSSEECGVYSGIIRKFRYNLVIYTIQTFTILSQPNRRDIETFKLHNTGIYKRFTITVVSHLKKVISK